MRSSLLDHAERSVEPGSFQLQNDRMLKVDLRGTGGFFFAKQGSMVAYQGDVDFAYEGSGGLGKMFKKAFTGEGMSLMKVSGSGDVFLAQDADQVFVLHLEDEGVTVNGANVLAFESSLAWDINRVEGASMLSGGLFNTTFTGTGSLAVTAFGTPVVLDVDVPTFVDMQAAVLWSTSLQSSIRKTAKLGAAIGRGSGEAYQLALSGHGSSSCRRRRATRRPRRSDRGRPRAQSSSTCTGSPGATAVTSAPTTASASACASALTRCEPEPRAVVRSSGCRPAGTTCAPSGSVWRTRTSCSRPGGEDHPAAATRRTSGRPVPGTPRSRSTTGRTNSSNDTYALTGLPGSASHGTPASVRDPAGGRAACRPRRAGRR